MPDLIEFAKDLLLTRGALVEMEEAGAIRAMLPGDLAHALESSEWLSLRFGGGPGCDDEGEWLERLGRLLPAASRVTGARLRRPGPAASINPATVLDRHLVIQNGIHRLLDHGPATALYAFFTFSYTIESDETSFGIAAACLNGSGSSVVTQADALLHTLHDELEDEPAFDIPRGEVARLFPIASRGVQPEIRRAAANAEQNANRRLARDAERLHSYYRGLIAQIEKRIARKSGDRAAVEKESARAAATSLDRDAKLEDLIRKYSLKIRIEPGDVLMVRLPVVEIAARIIRKKAERTAKFHWNTVLRTLEPPWCEACFAPAAPLFLCDDRVHFLCRSCLADCAACGRHFCRACQPKCKCGAG